MNTKQTRIRVYLERVKLDAGGYVRKGQALQFGQYYGIGQPLYRAYAEWEIPGQPGQFDIWEDEFRASDRDTAKDKTRSRIFPRLPDGARVVFAGKW